MGESSKKVILIDEYPEPLKLVESYNTPSGNNTGAVLATLFGTLSDYGNETRNDRWYTGLLWRKVLSDELLKEALDTKTLYGEADHPLDIENRLETHIPYISHIVRDPKMNEAKQCVEGYLDILDTPNGRIIKTLIDYGCVLGVSSRGSGDLVTIDGKTVVDENTYNFITWDIVARPSNKAARVKEIDTVNSSGHTAYESLKSQIDTMIVNKDIQSLKLTESLISKTDIPDKSEVLKLIKEAITPEIDSDDESDQKSSEKSKEDSIKKSDLDEAYRRILELKSENSKLDNENKSLNKSLEDSKNTINELEGLNRNLNSMVSSYMDELSKSTKSDHTMTDTKEVLDDERNEENFSKVLDAINKSHKKLSTKIAKINNRLDHAEDTNDLKDNCKKLSDDLDDAESKLADTKKLLDKEKSESLKLLKKVSVLTNEYFKVRCSQLGLNESMVRKEFNGKLYEYDLSDIEGVLTESYKSEHRDNSQNSLVENTSSKQLGSLQLTGSIKSRKFTENSSDEDDDYSSIVTSVKSVRNLK